MHNICKHRSKLYIAIKDKDLESVKTLLAQGENVNIGKRSTVTNITVSNLDLALSTNADDIAGVLIEFNAAITTKNYISIIKNELLVENILKRLRKDPRYIESFEPFLIYSMSTCELFQSLVPSFNLDGIDCEISDSDILKGLINIKNTSSRFVAITYLAHQAKPAAFLST